MDCKDEGRTRALGMSDHLDQAVFLASAAIISTIKHQQIGSKYLCVPSATVQVPGRSHRLDSWRHSRGRQIRSLIPRVDNRTKYWHSPFYLRPVGSNGDL